MNKKDLAQIDLVQIAVAAAIAASSAISKGVKMGSSVSLAINKLTKNAPAS